MPAFFLVVVAVGGTMRTILAPSFRARRGTAMNSTSALSDRLRSAVRRQRLVDTAVKLIEVPSPTGSAGAVSDLLADLLREDGFTVERPEAGHAAAPAVVVRLKSGRPGRT